MIIYGGSEIARLEKSLPDPEDPRRKLDGYQKLRVKRNAHFIPKKNKHYARYIYLKTRPEAREGWAVCASTAQEIRVRTAHVHTILCSVRIVNFRPVRTVYAVKIAVQNIFRFYVYPDTIPLKLSNSDNFAFDICLFRFLSIVFYILKNHQAFHVLQQSSLSFSSTVKFTSISQVEERGPLDLTH